MSIALARYNKTSHWSVEDLGSGYENLVYIFGGYWYCLDDIWETHYDVVCVSATDENLIVLNKIGKSPHWKKLILLEETGLFFPNRMHYAKLLMDSPGDAIFVHTEKATEIYKMFKRPVFNFVIPYPFFKAYQLRTIPKDKFKVSLNLARPDQQTSNWLGTLAIMNYLPKEVTAFVRTYNYNMLEDLQQIIKACGLADRVILQGSVDWHQHLKETADCKVAISMDNRHTYGRYDLDAAALGMRSIGAYTPVKQILFPEYIVDTSDIEKLLGLFAKNWRTQNLIQSHQKKRYFFLMNLLKRTLWQNSTHYSNKKIRGKKPRIPLPYLAPFVTGCCVSTTRCKASAT